MLIWPSRARPCPILRANLVTTSGEVIGEHGGIHNFTVGQRKGLGVATGSPLYVIQINGADKQVVVGGDEHLYSRTLRARRVNLISVDDLREPMRVSVKIRHRHEPAAAMIEKSWPTTKFWSPSTSRSAPSLPARPRCSTMATSLSAAAGSHKRSRKRLSRE